MEKFKDLGLCDDLLKAISAKKFTRPSEIQEKAIPLVLQGIDLIAGSATGSGKTLAFGSRIIRDTKKDKGIQALILAPTRELAEQVSRALENFSYSKRLTISAVYGGVSIDNQIKKLSYAEIVVATPGRLLDHLSRNSIDLTKLRTLVLDEADRMWDMGFKDDVAKIVEACPKNRQTLLFSATISNELEEFSDKYMKNPKEVSVEGYVDASKLKQIYYDVRNDGKFSLLAHLLKNEDAHLIMIFCNTRRNADFVNKNLKMKEINSQVIHGGLSQVKRNQVLKRFDNSNANVLVCTDVAARGLDIRGVSHVYNYDLPSDAKDYIHRIGRTARAGANGIAINIVASRDYDNFANIQKNNPDLKIENKPTPNFKKVYVKWNEPQRRKNSRDNSQRNRSDYRGRQSRGDKRSNNQGKNKNKRDRFRSKNIRNKSRRQ